MGFTSLLAMVIGISGPYVVHLGTIDVRYPYGIMAAISFVGAIAVGLSKIINGGYRSYNVTDPLLTVICRKLDEGIRIP